MRRMKYNILTKTCKVIRLSAYLLGPYSTHLDLNFPCSWLGIQTQTHLRLPFLPESIPTLDPLIRIQYGSRYKRLIRIQYGSGKERKNEYWEQKQHMSNNRIKPLGESSWSPRSNMFWSLLVLLCRWSQIIARKLNYRAQRNQLIQVVKSYK